MPWYEDWFGRDEYELVYRSRDEREAARVIDLLERVVRPATGAAVLDVGCGRGRHARVLARRGYDVTGVDLSEDVLAEARRLAGAEGLSIRFMRGDMREPVCSSCFDGVVNLFTAFGYFENDDDHLRALQAMTTALRSGGWFLQDFLNAPYVRRHLVREDTTLAEGVEIRQRRWIEDGRINKEISFRAANGHKTNAPARTFFESVRLLTLDDLRALYDAAGLELIDTFGDYDGNPYSEDSPRLVLYARKRSAHDRTDVDER